MNKKGFNTRAIHAGSEGFSPESMSVPIYQSVAYPYYDAKEAAAIFAAEKPGFTYGRWDNPTVQAYEKRMAALEGTESSIATSSGMAAIFLLTHHLMVAGDELVASNRVYGGTFGLFATGLERMGLIVKWVTDPSDLDSWEKQITPKTKYLFVESPSNPGLFIADLMALSGIAKKHNLPLVVDNTLCTSALQLPIELGADIVIHSTTKYICGNASSLGGIICGTEKFVEGIRRGPMRYLGPSLSPFNAWLNINGLEHLGVRMERHCSNALALATHLEKHPKVVSVNYPGLESNPFHHLMKAQMKGCGSLLSFVIKGTYEDAVTVIDSFKLWVHATHLGTAKTIVTHPASTTHSNMGHAELEKAGIPVTMIRVSVGIEDISDIIEDVEQALNKI